MATNPYDQKPSGFDFIARFPKNKDYSGYGEMVITDDGMLACLCKDGKWYAFRKAKPEDYEISKKCFRTWDELEAFYNNLIIAA